MKPPFSVHLIVALEWLLGGLLGFYCLMFVVFGIYGLLHLNFSRVFSSVSAAIAIAAIAAASFWAGVGLRHGHRWAWIISWSIGIAVILFGWFAFHEGLRETGHNFGLIVGPFLVVCALTGIVLLVLPQTRRHCDPTKKLDDSRQTML